MQLNKRGILLLIIILTIAASGFIILVFRVCGSMSSIP